MRTVLLVTFVVAVSSLDTNNEYKKNAKAALTNCMKTEGATEGDIKSLKDKEFPKTEKGQNVLACMLETAGIIKDNNYVVEGVYAVLNKYLSNEPEKLAAGRKAAEKCDKEVKPYNGKGRGQLAVKSIQCFRENAPALDISPQ